MTLFWLGLIWLAGIAIGSYSGLAAATYLIGAVLAISLALVSQASIRRIGVVIAVFLLGASRFALVTPDDALLAHNDSFSIATMTGVVSDFPDLRDEYVGLRVDAESVQYPDSDSRIPISGTVLVRADRFSDYRYGDRVQAIGILETPPEFEGFSYRDYLARQGIYSLMSNALVTRLEARQGNPVLQALFDIRLRALETINSLFPDPEASLLAGILLGIESGISTELREAFNVTSTTHIIAISGFNITILAALVITLSGRALGMRRGAIAAAIVIALYTILVGADAAVVRAAIMGGLVLFARFLGRLTLALASLAAAAFVMTLFNPLVIWDVGFQLSFAATLGLVLYADRAKGWIEGFATRWFSAPSAERLSRPVSEYLLFTLAAQVTTLPLTAFYFERLSLVSLIANPIILPVQPPLMILGGLATVAGMIWLPLGQMLAWLAWPFPAFTIRAVNTLANFPSAAVELGSISSASVVFFYAVLFGATAFLLLPRDRRPALPQPSLSLSVLFLGILAALSWKAVFDRPDGRIHLTTFGSGGSLIETAEGRFILIGGGPSSSALSASLGYRLPLFHREIDWLLALDGQIEGLSGIESRFRIRSALVPPRGGGRAHEGFYQALASDGIQVVEAAPGMLLDLGRNARLELVRTEGDELSVLLSADNVKIGVFGHNEPSPGISLGQLSALVLQSSAPQSWADKYNPHVVVSTGRPPAVSPGTLLSTDEYGWIELETDGQRLWVWSEHNTPKSQPMSDQ